MGRRDWEGWPEAPGTSSTAGCPHMDNLGENEKTGWGGSRKFGRLYLLFNVPSKEHLSYTKPLALCACILYGINECSRKPGKSMVMLLKSGVG